MKLHLVLTLTIVGVLVQSMIEAARLHLPTGATPQSAGAWLPDTPARPTEDPTGPEGPLPQAAQAAEWHPSSPGLALNLPPDPIR